MFEYVKHFEDDVLYKGERIKKLEEVVEELGEDVLNLRSALQWLLDDLTDANENKPEWSKEEYDSVANARKVMEETE